MGLVSGLNTTPASVFPPYRKEPLEGYPQTNVVLPFPFAATGHDRPPIFCPISGGGGELSENGCFLAATPHPPDPSPDQLCNAYPACPISSFSSSLLHGDGGPLRSVFQGELANALGRRKSSGAGGLGRAGPPAVPFSATAPAAGGGGRSPPPSMPAPMPGRPGVGGAPSIPGKV